MSINWPIVAIRVLDGFCYGSGFIAAVMMWVWIFQKDKKNG